MMNGKNRITGTKEPTEGTPGISPAVKKTVFLHHCNEHCSGVQILNKYKITDQRSK